MKNGDDLLCACMLTGLRTTREGDAPKLAKSRAISIPELPHPTTKTFFPANSTPLRYWLEWKTFPPRNSCMFLKLGMTGSAFSPEATTNHLALYSCTLPAAKCSPPSNSVLLEITDLTLTCQRDEVGLKVAESTWW